MRTEHWEEYYRGGWIVSSPMGSRDGYTGELLATWQTFFSSLPAGSRIVDIGTGNGAIALIARDIALARRRVFDIHGVDVAAINPAAWVTDGIRRYQGITFHPQTAAEALPFADASVAAVTGQYALEYTDVPIALREIARVLEPGGCALFIVHHSEGVLVRNARKSLEHGHLVLRETRVFERLRQFLEAERLAPTRARVLHRTLMRIGSELRARATQSTERQILEAVLLTLGRIFAARGRASTVELLKVAADAEQSLRAALLRLEDLIQVVQTRDQLERIVAEAERNGLQGEFDTQRHGGDTLIGWRLALQWHR